MFRSYLDSIVYYFFCIEVARSIRESESALMHREHSQVLIELLGEVFHMEAHGVHHQQWHRRILSN